MNVFPLVIRPVGMAMETLEQLVRWFFEVPRPWNTFAFEGGDEPLRAGLDFYLAFAGLVQQCAAPESRPMCRVQTCGALITDEWAQFFAAHNFQVIVNLDADILTGVGRLKKYDVPFTVRAVVTGANVEQPETLYRYLRDEVGCRRHLYVPSVDLAGEPWGGFLCGLYDTWFPSDTQVVSVHLFDTILAQMVQGIDVACECSSDCRRSLVVEPTGDIYPCAWYVSPEWRLGSITEGGLQGNLDWSLYEAFGRRKLKWPVKCHSCGAVRYCRGDCVKHRGEDGNSRLCSGWQAFYAHAMPTLSRLGWQLYQKAHGLKPGRNDPCPCGSGKKFKKCCWQAEASGNQG